MKKEKYSPVMMQYLKIKDENPDCILMYRIGDFYEMFFDDAFMVSKELDLTLTGKNAGVKERVPMCGVPFHSASSYIQRLVDNGHKVAVAEQLTEPGKKGIVERGVVQIVTPGTVFDESLTNTRNNYIASLIEFDFQYCVAYCDITTGEFNVVLLEKKEKTLINFLESYDMKEIVTKNDFTCLDQFFVSKYDQDNVNSNYSYMFEKITDLKEIKTCSLLINYMINTQKRELDHLQIIEEIQNTDYISMDPYTRTSLELVTNSRDHEKYGSLFWLLDKCQTAMGRRMLRQWIERPLLDKDKINYRLDIVEILTGEFIQRESIKEILKEVYDLERLSSKIAFGNINARDLRWIASSLKVLPELKDQLLSLNHPLTNELSKHIVDLSHIVDLVEKAIVEAPPLQVKEGEIIKDGFNAELDELRYIRDNGKEWLATFEANEREKTGIKNLKVGYNRVFGYYIEVSKGQLPFVKDEYQYTRKQSLTGGERFVTPELKEMESKLLSAQDKIVKLEYSIFTQIRDYIRKDVHLIQDVAKTVAMIDIYQSFAILASENSYVRPSFNDEHRVDIVSGRHGVVERVMAAGKYVANDVYCDQMTPITLITGPNMGGKSTYMRQIALMVVMSQIGSFVPAESASLPIFDSIFTRIGASDDLVSGQSTFMVEMLEANNALRFATENSLIIFDEIGRGTATFDGMAIAQAMIEYIAKEIKCITFFSTHYHELTFLEDKNLGIQNVHASASIDHDQLVFLYRIKKGRSHKSYGVNVAKLAKLPEAVTSRANDLLASLETNTIAHQLSNTATTQVVQKESEVEKYLEKIDPMTLSPLDALSTLIELKKML